MHACFLHVVLELRSKITSLRLSAALFRPFDSAIRHIWCQRWDSTPEVSEQRTLIALQLMNTRRSKSLTRSGRQYNTETAKMAEHEKLVELMEKMVQDREKREQEIAQERAKREEEIAQERTRREEEARAERARFQEERDFMRTQMEQLMKLMSETVKAPPRELKPTTGSQLTVKLAALTEKDDIKAYLVTFERIMEGQKIEKANWTQYLAPQLTGRAQLAFAALPSKDSGVYDTLKAAILARYDNNEEAYRQRFRTVSRGRSETNRELAIRPMDLQDKWLRACTTTSDIKEVCGIEQFLSTIPMEKKLWVMKRKPKTCVQAGELADEYEQARKGTPLEQPAQVRVKKCTHCGRTGHLEDSCPRKTEQSRGAGGSGQKTDREPLRCYRCQKPGHLRKEKLGLFCGEAGRSGIYREGMVENLGVSDILLDTGCSRTKVPESKYLEGDAVTIRCAHGDVTLYPLAEITVAEDGLLFQVEAAVSEKLPAAVLLGTDVPELSTLLGVDKLQEVVPQDVMVVVTRAQARRQLEEEILRCGKEIQSGAKSTKTAELEDQPEGASALEEASEKGLSKKQKREPRKQMHTSKVPENGATPTLDFSAGELQKMQQADPSLEKIQEAARGVPNSAGGGFFERNGLLYRRWVPPGREEEQRVEQLVLPYQCRKAVLEVGGEIPMAGHLGTEKTRQRIIRRFYWPTVFRDVDRFCKGCVNCQKSGKHRIPKAPMIPLPVIAEPFTRVAMDIVGPIPKSKSGYNYILVVCDYATQYPEAVPLRSIDAEHVAEELIKLFARVGIPQEILTDQGSNFMSQLLAELNWLLHVHSIRTTPYHPQTDGLVE